MNALYRFAREMSLRQVRFTDDQRHDGAEDAPDTTAPSAVGQTVEEAKKTVEDAGLNVTVKGSGSKVIDQVPAFVLPQHPSGVMTLSAAHPVYCCPLREREPILRLAKSALVTVYPLPDTRLLMVVNIHAVNFSLGVDVYSKQLLPIGDQIAHHSEISMPGAVEG